MNSHENDPLRTARECRHYAMCKIDCLGTGVCPSGSRNHYVSHYPQGMMDITAALLEERIPVTPALLDIADSCTLCGICDLQCHFVTGLRPLEVFRELKARVDLFRKGGGEPEPVPEDDFLRELRRITGEPFSTSDPAHMMAYAHDPCPISALTLPSYVTLPENTRQVSRIVRLCRREGVEWSVRGNGSSVMGFVLSPGLVIDTARMKTISFRTGDRSVTVGAGVSSMELQREALDRGYRVNTAEPSALYCANIMCSGIFSLFSSSCGTGLDNILDAEFVDDEGNIVHLSGPDGPNPCSFQRRPSPAPGICTRAVVRLHPVCEDESAVAVPFESMEAAVEYARELNKRDIGLGIGVLGTEYLGTFLAPVSSLSASMRRLFRKDLGIEYMVLVLGNRHHLAAARDMAPCVLEQGIIRAVTLGMPSLNRSGISSILKGMEGGEAPYHTLAQPGMQPLLEAALNSSPENLASAVDPDLRDAYRKLYRREGMTDILQLNSLRVISSRMGREGHVVAYIFYVPLDDPGLSLKIHEEFSQLTQRNGLRGDFGFLTPLERGSMGILEWDMYLDHTDDREVKKGQKAMAEAAEMIQGFHNLDSRILWIGFVFNRGYTRKESFLHSGSLLSNEQ